MYRHGWKTHPNSLVLRFNGIRHDLHLGEPGHIQEALDHIRLILNNTEGFGAIDPQEDIMPWDYHGAFFNYRSYLDTLTSGLGDGCLDTDKLKNLIFASLAHYLGLYTGEVDILEKSVHWNPEFPHYRFSLARALLLRNGIGDVDRAASLLHDLFNGSHLIAPTFQLLAEICWPYTSDF